METLLREELVLCWKQCLQFLFTSMNRMSSSPFVPSSCKHRNSMWVFMFTYQSHHFKYNLKKGGKKKRRLFPKVLCVTFVSSLKMRRYNVTLTTLLSQSKGSTMRDWTSTESTWKMPRWGEWKTHNQGKPRGMEGWEGYGVGRNANVTVDGFNAGHWPPFPSFLIQPIFRANLPQLSSLTKLFWLLPHYHNAPSLSLLLLTDPLQISYRTHLTWHALQFFLISPYYWLPVPLPSLIHEKQAQYGQKLSYTLACLPCLAFPWFLAPFSL